MASCPNKSLDSWKQLVSSRGEDIAYYLWELYEGEVPESESRSEIVKSGLKATNILQSPKADQFFNAVAKNKISGDFFWRKMQADLGIPKEQIEILKSFNTQDRGELISSLLANYSYVVEINVAKETTKGSEGYYAYEMDDNISVEKINDKFQIRKKSGKLLNDKFDTKEQALNSWVELTDEDNKPTQHYSYLTVPGGTNYTENEIATPDITPGIIGHGKFSTDKGIGWFRSDDELASENLSDDLIITEEDGVFFTTYQKEDRYIVQFVEGSSEQEVREKYSKLTGIKKEKPTIVGDTSNLKTRRILEVQSDLFQKGRDKELLIPDVGKKVADTRFGKDTRSIKLGQKFKAKDVWFEITGTGKNSNLEIIKQSNGVFIYKSDKSAFRNDAVLQVTNLSNGKVSDVSLGKIKEYLRNNISEKDINNPQNKFLQILNQGTNWVNFFIKSILQDSAKKGYEKVLFPSGNTASKVEGHTTLEQFKKQKEDRLSKLISDKQEIEDIKSGKIKDEAGFGQTKLNKELKQINNEINQLKQELERVETEGFGALKPIYNFYENTVANILKKQGYSPKQVTDENGNTWNEVEIVPEREQQVILFQKETEELPASKASPETINKIKELISKMGVNIQTLQEYLKGNPDVNAKSVAGLADLVKGIIAIAEGKEDVALTEEMIHIATAILEQTNPGLIKEMISKIDRFDIYKRVLKAYKNDPNYQTKDGKPDIRKIKKEAVDKLLAELIIKQSEGSTEFPELQNETVKSMLRTFWQKILDWFKGQYRNSNINIFEEVASKISEGDLGARYYNEVKPGVKELFESNPELAQIGTPEQYSAYLDSIFPESKVKDVVYHGSDVKFEEFLEDNLNYFGTKEIAKSYGENLYPSVIEIKNPYYEDGGNLSNQSYEDLYDKLDESGSDGFISDSKTLFVPKTEEQVHILGNEQDVEGFKTFLETAPAEFKGEGVYFQKNDIQSTIQQRLITNSKGIEKRESDKKEDLPLLMDGEEASNFYVRKNPDGTETVGIKRVTDRVKKWYEEKFGKKKFTKEQEQFNELKRELGVRFHNYLEEIHNRYFDSQTGERRTKVVPRTSTFSSEDEEVYERLEDYFVKLIDKFSGKGRSPLVFSEYIIYDPKEKEAGTIDLLIIDEKGKAHIFDWKFMSVGANQDDVPWYKQGAYNIQLGRYKEMLRTAYGVKEFGEMKAIPILFQFGRKNVKNPDSELVLKGIEVGSVDTTKIKDFRLMPVSESTESTGIEPLDEIIRQLNAVMEEVGKKDVTNEEERQYKKERLNIIRKAMRAAQASKNLAPLVEVIKTMKREGQQLVNDWEMVYSKKEPSANDIDNKQLSDFADDLNDYLSISDVFGRMHDIIGDTIYNDGMLKDAKTVAQKEALKINKKYSEEVRQQSESIRKSYNQIKKITGQFADKFIGERNLVKGLLSNEAVWKSLASWFRSTSDAPLASVQILNKLVGNAKNNAARSASTQIDELLKIKDKLAKRGGDLRKLVQQIYEKDDKGKIVNKLIRKYKKEFYDEVDKNALEENQDKNWLLQNINVEEYKKEAEEVLKKRLDKIKKDHKDDDELRAKLMLEERKQLDITRKDFTGWNNYIIKRHPVTKTNANGKVESKWFSEEYKNIEKDPDLLELFNFVHKMNDQAADAGYIQNKIQSTFLPFIRKSMAENLSWNFSISSVMDFGSSLSVRAEDVGFGSVNSLTGEMEYSIPKYYTYDFSVMKDKQGNIVTDEKGKALHDYTDVSEDLFKNLVLYIGHVNNYKYLSDVEGQIKLVKTVETFKNHLATSMTSRIITDANGKPIIEAGNEKNVQIFDQFMRALLYEQKYPLSESDVAMPISVRNYMKKAINAVAGREVIPPDENPSAISMNKTMDSLNRGFQLKTLGFEFISGAANAFGMAVQVAAQAGHYFKKGEYAANAAKLIENKFSNNDERKMFIELVELFMPLKEDPNYDRIKKAGMSKLTQQNFTDLLMVFMREPEILGEKAIFLSLLDNMMIEDGKIISIPEYVNSKYKGKYSSASAFRTQNADIQKEIAELKKTRSISATKKLEDGKLVIPGLDLNNLEEINRLTKLSRRISRNATGGMSDTEVNRVSMNIFGKSAMVFRGWIPKLVDTRFGELRKISDDFSVRINEDGMTEGQKYDIGRLRIFWEFASLNVFKMGQDIMDVLYVTEGGIERLDAYYEKMAEDYRKRTGEELEMTREEFMDFIRMNLKNQIQELTVLVALVGLAFSMGYFEPDDDEDKATKNAFRFAQRVIDKFVGELSFFYNPLEYERILDGSALPAIGLIGDIIRFFGHFGKEMTGFDFSDPTKSVEEVRKSAQPVKYAAKVFPLTKSLITYFAIFDSDFAKEYDVTIQSGNNR